MKLLLDTCTFVWLAAEPERLSPRARTALDEDAARLTLSDISVLELCLKWQAGKLSLPATPRLWIEEQAEVWQVARLCLKPSACYRTTELPDHHCDPFDRLLVAQAIEEGLTVVTPDAAVAAYPVATLW